MILRKIVFRHVNRRLNSARTAREYWLQVKKGRGNREREREKREGEEERSKPINFRKRERNSANGDKANRATCVHVQEIRNTQRHLCFFRYPSSTQRNSSTAKKGATSVYRGVMSADNECYPFYPSAAWLQYYKRQKGEGVEGRKGLEHDSRNWLKVFQAGKDKKGWTCARKRNVYTRIIRTMSDFRLFLNKVLANTFIAMRESREILGIFFFCFFPFFLKKKEKKRRLHFVYIGTKVGERSSVGNKDCRSLLADCTIVVASTVKTEMIRKRREAPASVVIKEDSYIERCRPRWKFFCEFWNRRQL